MNRIRSITIHVIGCGLFLVLPFLFSSDSGKTTPDELFANHFFRKALVHYILLIGFFYLNYYLLFTRFYRFEIVTMDIINKTKHVIAIHFFSEAVKWH